MHLPQSDTLFDLPDDDAPQGATLLDELPMTGAVVPSLVALLED